MRQAAHHVSPGLRHHPPHPPSAPWQHGLQGAVCLVHVLLAAWRASSTMDGSQCHGSVEGQGRSGRPSILPSHLHDVHHHPHFRTSHPPPTVRPARGHPRLSPTAVRLPQESLHPRRHQLPSIQHSGHVPHHAPDALPHAVPGPRQGLRSCMAHTTHAIRGAGGYHGTGVEVDPRLHQPPPHPHSGRQQPLEMAITALRCPTRRRSQPDTLQSLHQPHRQAHRHRLSPPEPDAVRGRHGDPTTDTQTGQWSPSTRGRAPSGRRQPLQCAVRQRLPPAEHLVRGVADGFASDRARPNG